MTRATQDETFVGSEADHWFERNREALASVDFDHDPPLRLVSLYKLPARSVLEIGAANGYRVAELARRTGAHATAVEPSQRAVADGRARYPHVDLRQGEARALPVDGPFDLVIVNFVFHWIDRANLLRCVAEVDRVIGDGGYLLIGDFFPATPTRVKYHHLADADVHTFKQDYSSVFVASGLYQPIAMLSGSGHDLDAGASDDGRAATWLLRKRLVDRYAMATFSPGKP
ncbi:MAG: methylase involved in ubiquinone/menaquinone biosynthesis-like [bacterium]|nr:methylase involved in ubiquinone/menaquinone biosynthesis-like [bacterium]